MALPLFLLVTGILEGAPLMVRVKETRQFSCKGIGGFTFSYPVFEGWESPGFFPEKGDGACVMYMEHPDGISFEIAPQVRVDKIKGLVAQKGSSLKKSAQGIAYDFVYDPSLYVAGHKPEPGLWNYLEFYGKEFGVRIEIMSVSLEYGFSLELFVQKVVETFRFE
jgi:hypothetical protein